MAALRERALKGKQPFDYDTPVEGMRALDRYTLQFKFEEPKPRFVETLADASLYGAVAREVVETYGDTMPAHPVGTGPVPAWRSGAARRASCWNAIRPIAMSCTTPNPNADDAEGQALLAKFKGRKLPMIDRVEMSIIEEVQPRWLSFLNKQSDLVWLVPFDFVNIAAPNGKLAPFLAKQGVQAVSDAGLGRHAVRTSTWKTRWLAAIRPTKLRCAARSGLRSISIRRFACSGAVRRCRRIQV